MTLPNFIFHQVMGSPMMRSFLIIFIPLLVKQMISLLFQEKRENNEKASPFNLSIVMTSFWLSFLLIWAFKIEIDLFIIVKKKKKTCKKKKLTIKKQLISIFYFLGFTKFMDSMFKKLGTETIILLVLSIIIFFISHVVGRFICVAIVGGCSITGYFVAYWQTKKKNYPTAEEEADTFILYFILTFSLSTLLHFAFSAIYHFAFEE